MQVELEEELRACIRDFDRAGTGKAGPPAHPPTQPTQPNAPPSGYDARVHTMPVLPMRVCICASVIVLV